MALNNDCSCGGSRSAPNGDCERCRLVWTLDRVVEMRAAQRQFITRPERDQMDEAKRLEGLVDRTLSRLNAVQPGLFDEVTI